MVPMKGQSLEAYAHTAVSALLENVAPEMGRWHEKSWDLIMRAICAEGQYMREGGPCALLVYERYVRVAVAYLSHIHDRKKAEELLHRAKSDMVKLASVLRQFRPCDLTKEEGVAMDRAVGDIFKMLHSLENVLRSSV